MVFAVVVDHSGGTQSVFGISLLAGEFQDCEECVQGDIVRPLNEGHGSHPAASGFFGEFIINNLITHHLIGSGATDIRQ